MTEQNTDLQKIEHALVEFSAVDAGIAALRSQYAGVVYDVTTPKGLAEAKAARAAIREPRYQVERIRKDAKAPLLALTRRLDGEAKRITDALLVLEEPIDAQVKAEEERVERERQAKVEAERRRVEAIQQQIASTRNLHTQFTARSTSAQIAGVLAMLDDAGSDFGWAQEFEPQAREAHGQAATKLCELRDAAIAHEAAVEALRVENERLAAERAEIARREAEARAQREAEAKAAREAEERERAAIAAERAEIERERAALAAEREAKARQEREAAEAAERARREEEERKAEAERVVAQAVAEVEAACAAVEAATGVASIELINVRPLPYPGDGAIVEAVAGFFDVPEVVAAAWLAQYGRVTQAA